MESRATQVTSRQREMLRAIRDLTAARGFPPTLHELSARLGMKAPGGAASGLQALIAKGCLTMEPRTARSMMMTPRGETETLEDLGPVGQDSVGSSGSVLACEAGGIRAST